MIKMITGTPRPDASRALELRNRHDRGDARRHRHRDGEDVVDHQRRARDERRVLAEVLAARRCRNRRRSGRRRSSGDTTSRRAPAGRRPRSRSARASTDRARGSTPPTAMTNRICCVAYAVDEIASEEKTASAIVFDDALVFLLRSGQRPTDEQSFQRVEHDAIRLRGRPLGSARTGDRAGVGSASACHFACHHGFDSANPSPCGNLTATLRMRSGAGRSIPPLLEGRRRTRCTSSSSAAAGWAASSPAPSSRAATRWRWSTRTPGAFRRLPTDFAGHQVVGFGFDRDHLEAAGIEQGRGVRRRSPAATTPTSCAPGSPARPTASSTWSPASTTPGGR